jgi:xanthine dehydrogenase YagT iron-sulfur-binding subunit
MENPAKQHFADAPADSEASTQPARLSRRRFLQSVGTSGIGAAGAPACATPAETAAPAERQARQDRQARHGQPITLTVNGTVHQLNVAPNTILLDLLRDRLLLTGTKKGCDHGQCGACTLHVNGIAVNACLSLAIMHDGDEITTIEGLTHDGKLHPIQQAFWAHDAYQCGYCTAGQMMSAAAILQDSRIAPDPAAVREAMSGNICRCGAYQNIMTAIQDARGKMRGAS